MYIDCCCYVIRTGAYAGLTYKCKGCLKGKRNIKTIFEVIKSKLQFC